jgi:hypothetical protein
MVGYRCPELRLGFSSSFGRLFLSKLPLGIKVIGSFDI